MPFKPLKILSNINTPTTYYHLLKTTLHALKQHYQYQQHQQNNTHFNRTYYHILQIIPKNIITIPHYINIQTTNQYHSHRVTERKQTLTGVRLTEHLSLKNSMVLKGALYRLYKIFSLKKMIERYQISGVVQN